MPNVDSIWLKTKELLTYHYGCHSNLVTKYDLNRTQDKRVIYITLVAMVTKLP